MSQTAFTERYRKWNAYQFSTVKVAAIHTEFKELIAMLPKNTFSILIVQEAISQANAVFKTEEVFHSDRYLNH